MRKYVPENFSADEEKILSRYFTNSDQPVFALVNLPEVVKGALFARYSRSSKSLRRLFLDEFFKEGDSVSGQSGSAGLARAEALYEKVLADFGDDSVAQLGGVHLACEQASNILTKVLERGRLMAYLEQSTRYIPYDKPLEDGSYRYLVPVEIAEAGLEDAYRRQMETLFVSYREFLDEVQGSLFATLDKDPEDSEFVFKSSVRAVALDAVRGMLPASVLSNVGIFASAQAYEALILRMRASELDEVRQYAEIMKVELDKVIPAFLARLDRPDRGGAWVEYLKTRNFAMSTDLKGGAGENTYTDESENGSVRLLRFDPKGERRIAAEVIFSQSDVTLTEATSLAEALSSAELESLINRYVGDRKNRRHKPGRAFEATSYLFEVECDYGAFRDLQRHRMLSIEWQVLGSSLGYIVPELVDEFGMRSRYDSIMSESKRFHEELTSSVGALVAAYAVPMAFRIRFTMQLNAREALHLIELRSSPQGHSSYRSIAQKMFTCIRDIAGHGNVAHSMSFVDMGEYRLGRISSLRNEESKNRGQSKQ